MLYSFITEVLGKTEDEFWRMSLRRMFALISMHELKHQKAEENKEREQLNAALKQMRNV